ncbi:MAG TPA: hypothetical protein VJ912_01135 [Candidatus Nanoarchaeia archaeon]|nr:hypothetical protein [Candidatus Nanoarchaeia archaeon]
MTKTKVLSICAMGANRSKYIAKYLRRKGYSTRYGGVKEDAIKPFYFKHVEWAEIIIFARKKHKEYFENKYGKNYYLGKKIFVLEVRDSGKDVPKELNYLHNLPREEFNKKWTHPNLRQKLREQKFVS